jgi:hypothetical protein
VNEPDPQELRDLAGYQYRLVVEIHANDLDFIQQRIVLFRRDRAVHRLRLKVYVRRHQSPLGFLELRDAQARISSTEIGRYVLPA